MRCPYRVQANRMAGGACRAVRAQADRLPGSSRWPLAVLLCSVVWLPAGCGNGSTSGEAEPEEVLAAAEDSLVVPVSPVDSPSIMRELAAAPGAWTPVSAAEMRATLDTAGPRATIRAFFGLGTGCGEAVLDSIAQGGDEWIDIADRLRDHSDACVTRTLRDGVALAVATAPERVLRLAGPRFPISDLCGLPFYEDSPDSLVAAHHARAVAAVRGITDPDLEQLRDECLANLARYRPR